MKKVFFVAIATIILVASAQSAEASHEGDGSGGSISTTSRASGVDGGTKEEEPPFDDGGGSTYPPPSSEIWQPGGTSQQMPLLPGEEMGDLDNLYPPSPSGGWKKMRIHTGLRLIIMLCRPWPQDPTLDECLYFEYVWNYSEGRWVPTRKWKDYVPNQDPPTTNREVDMTTLVNRLRAAGYQISPDWVQTFGANVLDTSPPS